MVHAPRRRLARNSVSALGLSISLGALAPVVTLSAVQPGPAPAAEAPQGRPNIVMIMADDMRKGDLRWMPKTRRLLGGEGARFTNSFASYPLCCPARASFLTGQYTHNHHVWSHRPPYGFTSFDDDRTLPVWLRRSGYKTLFLGKYLNGYGRQPLANGNPSVRYVPPGWSQWRGSIDGGLSKNNPKDGNTYRYRDMTLNVNGTLKPHQGQYSTRLIGQQSTDLIKRYAPKAAPFFLYASYVAPHAGRPIESDDPRGVLRNDGKITHIKTPAVPSSVRGRFNAQIPKAEGLPSERDVSDKPAFIRNLPRINKREASAMREAARQRAEAVWVLDSQVSRTIKALSAAGELGNTLVMFTSDNGYFQGEHRMRQGKTLPYEPSLRTPLLMRGPGIPHGVNRPSPFLTIDFAPTILDAAGANLRKSIDGQPLLGVARHGGGGWKRPVLTETGPRSTITGAAESRPPLKLGSTTRDDKPYSVGVRTRRYLYVEHLSGEKELYDMRTDPAQVRSVVDRPAYNRDQQQLARILSDLRHCAGAGCRRHLSSW
ncbi:MAG TPA: sulfatase [Nocardioidaceae bacterium]|nr:sulfatase [Nocardioidaceae bacterium]